jgi:hypothetical protein
MKAKITFKKSNSKFNSKFKGSSIVLILAYYTVLELYNIVN